MIQLSPEYLQVSQFLGKRGILQADQTICWWQKILLWGAFVGGGIVIYLWSWSTFFFWLNFFFAVLFLIASVYRLYLIDLSLRVQSQATVTGQGNDPQEWPQYIIQVPLYRESQAITPLTSALLALDYPRDRLKIQLLVEEDDWETKQAILDKDLPDTFQLIEIPVCYPRTKPKACNVGLALAEGDFLVIYDAEDQPDRDQLKKAVRAFLTLPQNVACVQAKLNFYNARRNLLTRLFAADYATWFDLCLPALAFLKAPIPLGGTSNHFRLDVLKKVKGWDEYNVTEDCDLGIRLFQRGYQTAILDSTTWEEATESWKSWFKQRSRWVKGYLQTYLVHMRSPWSLLRTVGIKNFLHIQSLIGLSVLGQLLNPFYWVLVLIWLMAVLGGGHYWQLLADFQHSLSQFYPLSIFLLAASCLFIGNFCLVYSCAVACYVRGFFDIVFYTLLMPVYWFMMGLAAWKGTLQLIYRPHYWEKTAHYQRVRQATF